ncbi:MAG: C1 family peptidase [Candidatus Omnitrophota bacterium]|nr:C1 family peptidase [Candidatus Omnitrophota bacterium]
MRRLGCLKDPRDLRDIPMGLVLPPIPLPPNIDYTENMTPVRSQGDEGTCVAFASVVGMKEYQDTKEYKNLISLSPRYLYQLCKKYDGSPEEDGTYPRVAMKILLNYGTPPENYWPYRPHQSDKPKTGSGKAAVKYKIMAYARLKTMPDMKRSLVINGPFLAGVDVYESWFTKKAAKTGLIPMPKKKEIYQGGHAICVIGYDDPKKLFKFKNSWGDRWGDGGYGYFNYDYMKQYCVDAWSATDLIENPKALVKRREDVLVRYT